MSDITRRRVLQVLASAPFAAFAGGCGQGVSSGSGGLGSSGSSGSGSGSSGSGASSGGSGTATTATLGSEESIPHPLYGLNTGTNLAHFIGDTAFMETFGRLGPALLRYPGGNSANWFDLSTGLVLSNPNPPPPSDQIGAFGVPPGFTFSALENLLTQAGAQPTIVLNLLTGDMQSQIADLQNAASTVMISKIELGNEFYLNGVQGDQYVQVFPTVQDYAQTANTWAAAIRAALPSVEIGVPVVANDSGTTRESSWNQTLIPLLSSDINALIPHNYQNLPNPPFTGISVAADAEALATPGGVAAVFSLVQVGTGHMKKIAGQWPNYKIWNTETNLRDAVGAVAGTWTHGLYVAYQLLALLEVPNIAQALVHAVTDKGEFSAIWSTSGSFPDSSTQFAQDTLSASGLSMQMVFRAARGQASAQPIAFSENPTQTGANGGTAPSLYGWSFGGDAAGVVLNLSSTDYALVFSDKSAFAGAAYTQLAGAPTAYVGPPSGLSQAQGAFDATSGLALPAYSITLLGG